MSIQKQYRIDIMKGLKLIICVFFILGTIQYSTAQDARFSQFYTAPLHTNPAFTGVFSGQYRATINYRNQWSSFLARSAFNTVGASFDIRFKTNRTDYFAAGLSILRDDAGDSRFNQTKANLAVSYLKKLGGSRYNTTSHYVTVGFQGGAAQNGIDWSRLSFSSQFNQEDEIFVPSDPTGETFGANSTVYMDFNAGLAWYAVFEDEMSLYAGLALHHLTRPNVSFYDESNETLYAKYIAQVGGQIPFTTSLSILPAAIFTLQGPSNETVFGANFRYSSNDRNEVALRLGGWTRIVGDNYSALALESFTVTSMLEIENFLLGLSYDVNLSSLQRASNGRGAFEFSFTYIGAEKTRYKTICPKF